VKRKFMPFVCFDQDERPGGAPPAPEATAPPAAPVAPPAPPAVGDGPWSADLHALFPDETIRGQVDQFLRSKVQPHVTQVEQQFAPAKELWNDLQQDPIDTYVAIAHELFGPDVATAVASQVQQQQAQPPAPAPDATAAQLTPEQQSAIEWAESQRAEQEWNSQFARVDGLAPRDAEGNSIIKSERAFAPFVVAAEGDFDQALEGYKQWYSEVTPAPPAEAPAVPPPAVLDGSAAPAAIPPTVPQRQTLDAALDDTLAEMRATRAPATVGQV
jgi:hypothetical protein